MSDGKDEHLKDLPDVLVLDRDENHTLIGLKVTNQWLDKNQKIFDQLKQLSSENG